MVFLFVHQHLEYIIQLVHAVYMVVSCAHINGARDALLLAYHLESVQRIKLLGKIRNTAIHRMPLLELLPLTRM